MYRHTNEKKKFVISRNQKYTYPLGSAAKNQWIKKKKKKNICAEMAIQCN